jgi:iron complex transport system substrate-binding protein
VPPYPSRIVCLTEETTEILYRLGEGDRVVGVSGYTVRPPEARAKPKVSSYLSANYDKIVALAPDLVLAFSDLQAELASTLVKRGVQVFTFNQRSVEEILQVVRVLGGIVGCQSRAEALADALRRGLDEIAEDASRLRVHPRVYFEEWPDPLISGIQWVEELIEVAGGTPVFPELRRCGLARDRIVDPAEVSRRDPDLVVASWCGKAVRKEVIRQRAGWDRVTAIRNDAVFEIDSSSILQPGPGALTDGVRQLHDIITRVCDAG